MPTLKDRLKLVHEFELPYLSVVGNKTDGKQDIVLQLDDGSKEYRLFSRDKKHFFEDLIKAISPEKTCEYARNLSEFCWNKKNPKEFYMEIKNGSVFLDSNTLDCHAIYEEGVNHTHLYLVPALQKRGKKKKPIKKNKE